MLTANYSSVLSLEYSKGFNESDAINTIHTGHNKRTSKFLFDTIFRISSGVSNAFDFRIPKTRSSIPKIPA